MRGRFLTRTSSTIMLAFAGALATATLATAAAPAPNFNVTAMPGNEAEDAIAVNPTNPSNVVASGRYVLVCVTQKDFRPVPGPKEVREKIARFHEDPAPAEATRPAGLS